MTDPKIFDYYKAIQDSLDSMGDEEFSACMSLFASPMKMLEQFPVRFYFRWLAITIGYGREAYARAKEAELNGKYYTTVATEGPSVN